MKDVILPTDIYHVHTFRCGHAEIITDEAYIQKAIEYGATGIWFTDHAPFPGDPFGNRMKYDELEEYISTLSHYKTAYSDSISVHIGLEIEYFPSFEAYYKELRTNSDIEMLLLGQHMAETVPGKYTFSWDKERLKKEEFSALGNAIVDGIETGYFDAVAHPDRIFRRCKLWNDDMQSVSEEIIHAAQKHMIPLEKNVSSMTQKHHFWQQFWASVPSDVQKIIGVDAHSVQELDYYSEMV